MENPTDFHFHTTADGSPSLSFGPIGEWMHHRSGAFSETQYVYGEAITLAWGTKARRFASVGLGLGYLEILLAAWAERDRGVEAVRLRSFESDAHLRRSFTDWVFHAPSSAASLYAAYNSITDRTAALYDVAPSLIRFRLKEWHVAGQWTCEPGLSEETAWQHPVDAILYDPFSSETCPQLWSEAWLGSFLEKAAAPRCVFASYASTSVLKKSLGRKRFRLIPREGFAGKRECTLAVRP